MTAALIALALISQSPDVAPLPAPLVDLADATFKYERHKAGVPALRRDPRLDAAAADQAKYCAERSRTMTSEEALTHIGPKGLENAWDRAKFRGYDSLAWSYRGVREIGSFQPIPETIPGWVESGGHRRIMLGPDFQDYGLAGYSRPGGGESWFMTFARHEPLKQSASAPAATPKADRRPPDGETMNGEPYLFIDHRAAYWGDKGTSADPDGAIRAARDRLKLPAMARHPALDAAAREEVARYLRTGDPHPITSADMARLGWPLRKGTPPGYRGGMIENWADWGGSEYALGPLLNYVVRYKDAPSGHVRDFLGAWTHYGLAEHYDPASGRHVLAFFYGYLPR